MQLHKEWLTDAAQFRPEVLEWIQKHNFWNIWVPTEFGGEELTFTQGLEKLQSLARIDGSLGWTVTLCSGANFFIGNLPPETVKEYFAQPAIFGGSGGQFGTAEKVEGGYQLNGKWRYATGAPYLTHFTLNARIVENGKEILQKDGTPQFLSFVIPAREVTIVEDWKTMGLQASATHSFTVNNVFAPERYSFVYNQFYLQQPVYKIHFSVFADFTLLVNYIGMAEHFLAIAERINQHQSAALKLAISKANAFVKTQSEQIELLVQKERNFDEVEMSQIHQKASLLVKSLSEGIVKVYPFLGVKGSTQGTELNQVFRDYFTATQHHIFTQRRS